VPPQRPGRLRGLLVDIEPLRRDGQFRLLWSGQAVSGIGNQITRIALPYQVWVLTGSTLAIAALTFVQLVPILVFVLGAGSLADAVDRRRLLLVTNVLMALTSLVLVGLALVPAPPLIAIFAVAFASAGLGAVDQPTRSSSVARLVPSARLPSALALNQLNGQVASVVGPALGGLLIATVGLAGAYAVDVLHANEAGLGGLAATDLDRVVVAYEPGWAIGAGASSAPVGHITAMHEAVAGWLSRRGARRARVIYGGSVDPEASAELVAEPLVSGLFVGRAALDPVEFARIARVGLDVGSRRD
jgi:MFS family permease